MDANAVEIYDVVGVGFGPSNLAFAIALEENGAGSPAGPVASAFFERQSSFGWHRNMLLPSATMQVSFLKDLATLRNPVSRFGFLSFLHASDRLEKFINTQTFFPTREEFHQYLDWAQALFSDRVSYGSEVAGIQLPVETSSKTAQYLQVRVRDSGTGDTRTVAARNVVISTGLVPQVPDGVASDERVWHSSEFLERFKQARPDTLKKVAVVGAGQSGAEIARFMYDNLPQAQVYAIIPSYGYSIADDTPFANRVFDSTAVDDYYFGTERAREAFWRYHKNTNYSVVDDEVIRDLYQRMYMEELRGTKRLNILNMARVTNVKRMGNESRVSMESLLDGGSQDLDVDALVFATGYDAMDPSDVLGDLDGYCLRDGAGRYRIDRDYRLVTTPDVSCGIYLQGGTEHTHGLTSSLLSNIAVRGGEIADSILQRRSVDGPATPVLTTPA
ncbi:lysine N(6)-hydroxylase/L-ornithine N(5)-oxygenase family protein [Streptomyces sp. NBC_01255]|uniref:lysine N(6)-hydroxylase/L-ornithine N(5)-oxygenase family protein n=1 Tax=Streptomyces sp. NBC_01255 TaxID=2903798 RepID=UPI002E3677CE|nr:SidA/IucD/PvdA family monooxygenase [Streptomyces sp. NBC_01255]